MIEEKVWTWSKEQRLVGRREGQIETPERQLARRFGAPLPPWVNPRLDAPSLNALFSAR